jgi:aspartokinase
MNPDSINFDMLFDADEYHRSGFCPWTFFAYPTSLADERGLPPDDDACTLLARLQRHGIDVAIWVNGIADDTTYFACRKEDIQRLHETLQELEASGVIEADFLTRRSECLFATLAEGTESRKGHHCR